MGDRGYEGDSGYLAHLGAHFGAPPGPVGRPDGWEAERRQAPPPQDPAAADVSDATFSDAGVSDVTDDAAAAAVARRLQDRLDRHLRLLDHLHTDQLHPEPPGLAELQDTARRMRRDTESLLLLCGQELGVGPGDPRRLGDLLADVAGGADEARRVEVRPGPAAHVAPAAAVELRHVLAELVGHVTAVHPGVRVELVGRLDDGPDGRGAAVGAAVDVVVDGPALPDAEGLHGGRAVAEQLAHRSRHGIALRRPPAEGARAGLVASVHCPAPAVTVEEPEPPRRPEPPEPAGAGLRGGPGFGALGNGLGPAAGYGTGYDSAYDSSYDTGHDTGWAAGGAEHANGVTNGVTNGTSNGVSNGEARPTLSFDETPTYSPSPSSQVDELFGPLLDLPLEPIDDRYATPIFEAIASAWFREGEGDEGGADGGDRGVLDWQTPQDDEWREAAARAARSESASEAPQPTTASGLPRRNPGDQLVPPPRSREDSGGAAERVPDRVRDRLGSYQRGLREGRHRAEGVDPENW